MGILKDITDALKDAKSLGKEVKGLQSEINSRRGTSLARMSSDATLQFPIIISRSINIDNAQSVSKALERQYANFVQLVISLNPHMDLDEDKDVIGYIKKNIHQNNINALDLMESATSVLSNEAYGVYLLTSINNGSNANITRSNKEQMFSVEECLNMNSVNNLYQPASINYGIAESSLKYFCKKNNIVMEATPADVDNLPDDRRDSPLRKLQAKHQFGRDNANDAYQRQQDLQRQNERAADRAYKQQQDQMQAAEREADRAYKRQQDEMNRAERADDRAYRRTQDDLNRDEREADRAYKQSQDEMNRAERAADRAYKQSQDDLNRAERADDRAYNRARDAKRDADYEDDKAYNRAKDAKKDADYEEEKRYKRSRDKAQDLKDSRKEQRDIEKLEMDRVKLARDLEKDQIEYRSKAMVKLADNDVKKSNELVPTTLSLTMNVIKGERSVGNQTYLIGVKGLMHPVDSEEMVSNLMDGFKSGNAFFNFIRWTTGEIAFIKDFVFNVSGIKEDVMRKHQGQSHWWTALKRRRQIAKSKNFQKGRKLLPNASIVCSIEEVIEIKEAYGIDIMDPRNMRRLMDRYFLLGFVIVDASQELCHVIFDGENSFQVISFNGLEKENNSRNEFKDIYKLINSGRI